MRVLCIVILRLADQVARIGLGDQQVRAVGILGHQPIATMKAADSGDAARDRRGGTERQRAAHAITLHPSLACLAGLGLSIQKRQIGLGIMIDAIIRHGRAVAGQPGALLGIAEIEIVADHRRFGRAVEGVGHQHHITLACQAAAHIAERWAQAHNVGPHQNCRPASLACRVKQHGITAAVGGFHLDVFLHDIGLGQSGRAGGAGGCNSHQAEAAPRKPGIGDKAGVNEVVAHAVPPFFCRGSKGARTPAVKRTTPRRRVGKSGE